MGRRTTWSSVSRAPRAPKRSAPRIATSRRSYIPTSRASRRRTPSRKSARPTTSCPTRNAAERTTTSSGAPRAPMSCPYAPRRRRQWAPCCFNLWRRREHSSLVRGDVRQVSPQLHRRRNPEVRTPRGTEHRGCPHARRSAPGLRPAGRRSCLPALPPMWRVRTRLAVSVPFLRATGDDRGRGDRSRPHPRGGALGSIFEMPLQGLGIHKLYLRLHLFVEPEMTK